MIVTLSDEEIEKIELIYRAVDKLDYPSHHYIFDGLEVLDKVLAAARGRNQMIRENFARHGEPA